MRGLILIALGLTTSFPVLGAETVVVEAKRWPGSDSTLDALAPFTVTVIACTAKEKAEIVKRHSSHISTAMDLGGGEVVHGGGTVTYAYCRQKFETVEVLHGNANTGDRVLQYGYVEESDAFPGPRNEKAIPFKAKAILLVGKEGRIMKALPDTVENRDAVRSALSRYAERERARKTTLPKP